MAVPGKALCMLAFASILLARQYQARHWYFAIILAWQYYQARLAFASISTFSVAVPVPYQGTDILLSFWRGSTRQGTGILAFASILSVVATHKALV